MGATVGLTMGLLLGTYSVLRYGPGHRGYLATVGQTMLMSGASFSFFLSIGSCLRNEGEVPEVSKNSGRKLLYLEQRKYSKYV
ncbi:subunit of TIM23 translocase complex [Lobulomyces angularis]|nr:subunit of TIM23 translocase complex [Lobulomyces angularis]